MVKTRKDVKKAQSQAKKRKSDKAEKPLLGNGKQSKMDAEGRAEKTVKRGKKNADPELETRSKGADNFSEPEMSDQEVAEANFREDGKIVKMQVQKGRDPKVRSSKNVSGAAAEQADKDGEITEDYETEESSDEETESDSDSEVVLSSQNNNATTAKYKGRASSPTDKQETEEELDYEDDVMHSGSERPEEPSSEDEEELLRAKLKKQKKKKRKNKEEQETLVMIEKYCAKNGLELQKSGKRSAGRDRPKAVDRFRSPAGGRGGKTKFRRWSENQVFNSPSEMTIYRNAVKRVSPARPSPSVVNRVKDHTNQFSHLAPQQYINERLSERFIAECRIRDRSQPRPGTSQQGGGDRETQPRPGGSRFRDKEQEGFSEEEYFDHGEARANKVIKEAEVAKARLYELPGEIVVSEAPRFMPGAQGDAQNPNLSLQNQFVHSAMVDEGYSVVAMHLEDTVCAKIVNHEYVDFSKLLAKDRIAEDDRGVELVPMLHGGKTIFAPPIDRENAITSFSKWEQAFRVYSAIYTKTYPGRAHELIQYNHMIHNAATTFIWSNVYSYDRDFRIHMSKNPGRAWGIILQQAWAFQLKTKLSEIPGSQPGRGGEKGKWNNPAKREVCYRYNRGKCSYGNNCKLEHRCGICSKRGHGSWNCRKIIPSDNKSSAHNQNPVVETKDKETGEKKRRTDP